MIPESSKLHNSILCGIAALVVITASVGAHCLAAESGASFAFIDANDGRVYAQAGPGRLVAVDGKTGSVLWDFRSENLSAFTRAVFTPDALLVAGVGSDSNSELIRLNLASGKADWRAPIPRPGGNASPVLCGEEVLVPDYWNRSVHAFSMATGRNDWKTDSLPFLLLFPPAVVDNSGLFLGADRKEPESAQELVAVSCGDGQPHRTLSVRIEGVSRTPVLRYKDSFILLGYDRWKGTSLKAIRMKDGVQLWSASVPDEIGRFTPVIQDDLLVAGALSLWVIDLRTGKTVFSDALPIPSVPVAVANDLVFFSRSSRTVEARELPSGRLRWKAKLKGRISSNIVVTDGRVYVKIGDHELAKLRLTGEIDSYIELGKPGTSASGVLH
jgi:outer membrane protein assembly factor BamB